MLCGLATDFNKTNIIVPLIEMWLRVLDQGNHASTPILGMVGILPNGCGD